jgi:predicted alpha/beta-fold hydrolase
LATQESSALPSPASAGRRRTVDENGAFRPPWWGRNGHVQTIWGPLFRNNRLPLRRERLSTPDGDFVDLDWLDGKGLDEGAPRLLVLHGLEGSSRSHYVTGLLQAGRAAGWQGVALNFRSCSGELNHLPRFYHSGETGDLAWVVRALVARAPGVPIGAVGVSLGGNVLLTTNLTGHPAVTMPSGFRDDGTPVSISFIGNLWGEAELCRVAAAWQDATKWHQRHPAAFQA